MTDVGYMPGASRPRSSPRDQEIAALASRQHGVVAHRQLLAMGLSRFTVQHRLRAGRLHQVHVGVYAVGHQLVSLHGRRMAAVLAYGPASVISHRDAAALWGIRPSSRCVIDVTAPCASRRRRPRIEVHRTRRLDPEDRASKDGVPVTTVARTLLDLAEVVRPSDLDRAIEAAERLQLFDLRTVDEVVARSAGRRGLRPLTAALESYRPIPPVTRSELERRFVHLCCDAGLPSPTVNGLVADIEVDAVWDQARLVVELDGRQVHGTIAAFERDRMRDATLQLAGYRVLRVTHRRLLGEPEAVLLNVRRLLAPEPH